MATDELGSSREDLINTTSSMPLTREQLYKLVWSEPMIKVADRYGVSSSYMARVFTLLNVPRPERGYWAKLAVGKAPPIPPLPDAQPGDELIWSRDGQHIKITRPLPSPPSNMKKRRTKQKEVRTESHPLTKGVGELFEKGRLSHDVGYLKPYKRLLVDLIVTKTSLETALTFANNLFWHLEDYGYRVMIAPKSEYYHRAEVDEHEVPRKNHVYNNLWSPWRCTVVYVGTVAIGLTIVEMSEEAEARYVNGEFIRERDNIPPKRGRYEYDHSWSTMMDFPTGRLRLQAYSPYPGTKWVNQWQEKNSGDLNKKIKSIIRELKQAAKLIPDLVAEAERQAEIERQRREAQFEKWLREDEERRAAEAIKESREELFQIIDCWAESNRIEQFFKDAEMKAAVLSETEKNKIHERLKLARDLFGSVDALDHFRDWRSPDER